MSEEAEKLSAELDEFAAMAFDIKKERDKFGKALLLVRELIEGYVDIKDGDHGPLPNNAMRATQIIDAALGERVMEAGDGGAIAKAESSHDA